MDSVKASIALVASVAILVGVLIWLAFSGGGAVEPFEDPGVGLSIADLEGDLPENDPLPGADPEASPEAGSEPTVAEVLSSPSVFTPDRVYSVQSERSHELSATARPIGKIATPSLSARWVWNERELYQETVLAVEDDQVLRSRRRYEGVTVLAGERTRMLPLPRGEIEIDADRRTSALVSPEFVRLLERSAHAWEVRDAVVLSRTAGAPSWPIDTVAIGRVVLSLLPEGFELEPTSGVAQAVGLPGLERLQFSVGYEVIGAPGLSEVERGDLKVSGNMLLSALSGFSLSLNGSANVFGRGVEEDGSPNRSHLTGTFLLQHHMTPARPKAETR